MLGNLIRLIRPSVRRSGGQLEVIAVARRPSLLSIEIDSSEQRKAERFEKWELYSYFDFKRTEFAKHCSNGKKYWNCAVFGC